MIWTVIFLEKSFNIFFEWCNSISQSQKLRRVSVWRIKSKIHSRFGNVLLDLVRLAYCSNKMRSVYYPNFGWRIRQSVYEGLWAVKFSPVLFYFWKKIAMHLGHLQSTKVRIGAVRVRDIPPISNYFMYFAFHLSNGIRVASRVFVTALYLGHLRLLFYGIRFESRDRCSACKEIFPYSSVLQFIALYPLNWYVNLRVALAIAVYLGLCLWHTTQSRDWCNACKGIFPHSSWI